MPATKGDPCAKIHVWTVENDEITSESFMTRAGLAISFWEPDAK
jgi:hypothetical protein